MRPGVLFFIALLTLCSTSVVRGEEVPSELKDVGITEKLGTQVSIDSLSFRDESGREVKLSQYFNGHKPVILSLVYYSCPNLCTFVLNGMVDALKKLDWVPGNQFEMVNVSIDPRETPDLATKKKAAYLASLGKPEIGPGWHFLTGEETQIKKLASEVGFGYRYDERDSQYAHGAALFVLTPQGKLSRILYGIEYRPTDVKLSLLEASDGKVGTIVDRILLFCYKYDPVTRKYSVFLTKIVQAGGALTILVFGGYMALFWFRQRRSGGGLRPSPKGA